MSNLNDWKTNPNNLLKTEGPQVLKHNEYNFGSYPHWHWDDLFFVLYPKQQYCDIVSCFLGFSCWPVTYFSKKTWQSGKLTYCWWFRNPAPFGSIWDVSNLVNNGISATTLRIYCCPANSGFVGSPELRPPFGHLLFLWWKLSHGTSQKIMK